MKAILIPKHEIHRMIDDLAQQIRLDYANREFTVVGVLDGAFMFTADLVRVINLPQMRIKFVHASSYGMSKISTGTVRVEKIPTGLSANENVLIVDDIIDTGFTINRIAESLRDLGVKRIAACTLLDKKSRRVTIPNVPLYVGIEIPNKFVFGYGMDFEGRLRYLEDIWYEY